MHDCMNLLNYSYQLLNSDYSFCKFITEAVSIFYCQNVFEINILDVSNFIWMLKQMSFLKSFDSLSVILCLCLWLNCDELSTIASHWCAWQREMTSFDETHNFAIKKYEWNNIEKKNCLKLVWQSWSIFQF